MFRFMGAQISRQTLEICRETFPKSLSLMNRPNCVKQKEGNSLYYIFIYIIYINNICKFM
jgi:hypothetical protein